eukprot:GHVP01015106.1.p2 GENE.GHVP01015106.1~~GHVP01015106.1.p2  ORF type:complete len:466 (-),score=81.11 GHVP01015106.1:2657-4054(-)
MDLILLTLNFLDILATKVVPGALGWVWKEVALNTCLTMLTSRPIKVSSSFTSLDESHETRDATSLVLLKILISILIFVMTLGISGGLAVIWTKKERDEISSIQFMVEELDHRKNHTSPLEPDNEKQIIARLPTSRIHDKLKSSGFALKTWKMLTSSSSAIPMWAILLVQDITMEAAVKFLFHRIPKRLRRTLVALTFASILTASSGFLVLKVKTVPSETKNTTTYQWDVVFRSLFVKDFGLVATFLYPLVMTSIMAVLQINIFEPKSQAAADTPFWANAWGFFSSSGAFVVAWAWQDLIGLIRKTGNANFPVLTAIYTATVTTVVGLLFVGAATSWQAQGESQGELEEIEREALDEIKGQVSETEEIEFTDGEILNQKTQKVARESKKRMVNLVILAVGLNVGWSWIDIAGKIYNRTVSTWIPPGRPTFAVLLLLMYGTISTQFLGTASTLLLALLEHKQRELEK